MRILSKEELANNLGYCSYYIGTHMLVPDGKGKLRVCDNFVSKVNEQVLIFNIDDRFIDKDGNYNKSRMVDKATGNIYYWLGGILVYKEKDDHSSIDIIEATGRNNVYCKVKDDDISDVLSGNKMICHHDLMSNYSFHPTFPGDDLDEFNSNEMVITNGNTNSGRVLLGVGGRSVYKEFFSDAIEGEEGSVVKLHWALGGNFVAIPLNVCDDESKEYTASRKAHSNILDINGMIDMVNSKRAESSEDITDEILSGIIYLYTQILEGHLEKDSELLPDLFTYCKTYIKEVPLDKVSFNSNAESFKDRAAKLLGL